MKAFNYSIDDWFVDYQIYFGKSKDTGTGSCGLPLQIFVDSLKEIGVNSEIAQERAKCMVVAMTYLRKNWKEIFDVGDGAIRHEKGKPINPSILTVLHKFFAYKRGCKELGEQLPLEDFLVELENEILN